MIIITEMIIYGTKTRLKFKLHLFVLPSPYTIISTNEQWSLCYATAGESRSTSAGHLAY